MAKRIPVTVKKSFRVQTPEEQVRFEQAIDLLIGELVENEMRRREQERRTSAIDVQPEVGTGGHT